MDLDNSSQEPDVSLNNILKAVKEQSDINSRFRLTRFISIKTRSTRVYSISCYSGHRRLCRVKHMLAMYLKYQWYITKMVY